MDRGEAGAAVQSGALVVRRHPGTLLRRYQVAAVVVSEPVFRTEGRQARRQRGLHSVFLRPMAGGVPLVDQAGVQTRSGLALWCHGRQTDRQVSRHRGH